MGSKGGKRGLETMTAAERKARAKKASEIAAAERTAEPFLPQAVGGRCIAGHRGENPDAMRGKPDGLTRIYAMTVAWGERLTFL
jgi:hypothetical protein